MKIKIEATIPTTQYGNLRPTFEIENEGEEELAQAKLKELWNRFGETPLKDKGVGTVAVVSSAVEVKTFTGETILWNESTHTYTDLKGNVLLSGSKYANDHSPKFDLAMMLPKTAKAWEVDESALNNIWKTNGEISTSWGTSIHKALESYHLYHEIGKKIQAQKEMDNNYVLPKNKFIRSLVLSFVEAFGANALTEVLISDVENGRAGTIDRLEILDEAAKTCRVGDYKTSNEMDKKKLLKYQKQLSFYAHILIAKGWKVTGLDLFYLDEDSNWVKEEMEVLDLE